MFTDAILKEHLETSSTIKSQAAIVAEWNLNLTGNIFKTGNYRYRPFDADGSIYKTIPNTFDENDIGNFYTDATDSDIIVDGGFEDTEIPTTFLSKKEKEKLLYSLEECFTRFRPRSGINKLRYFEDQFTHFSNINMAQRPRYYMSDKTDKFKYWTSYRTENNIERGIANKTINDQYYIDDAAPYVVYKDSVPSNRIVIKMQTNTGSIDLGPFTTSSGAINDPFYGDSNKTVPSKWRIQYLDNNNWIDAKTFDRNSLRKDGSAIIKSDGYVELSYGLIVPEQYLDIFVYIRTLSSPDLLSNSGRIGSAYLIKSNEYDIGTYYILTQNGYETFPAIYDWYLSEEEIRPSSSFLKDLTAPEQYISSIDGGIKYRDFQYVNGIRIVVDTMNKNEAIFDLIEMSPRLTAELSDRTVSYTITKAASDLGVSGMPVGQLLASTGKLDIFDFDQAFNKNNTESIVAPFVEQNLQIKFYEIISNVLGYDYYVPIKTMYSEGFPQINVTSRDVSLDLRDLFFYFESFTAPEILIQNASVSYAISLLLDSIGFSNYAFKRNVGETEPIIPYFFIAPQKTIAEVLEDIALSTQTAMFFDEYNNFIAMSKNYMMPTEAERATDITLYGTSNQIDSGVLENGTIVPELENIMDVSSSTNSIFNDGKISYISRYIQRSFGSIRQANQIDRNKTWKYKAAQLWEVSPSSNTKSVNDELSDQSSYALTAIPLNSNLTSTLPVVSNHLVINNIMDFGEAIYWIGRYNGYFYSNGEIIKYDAVQYNIPSIGGSSGIEEVTSNNVWITSVQEYQNYFSKLSFNGKIYPTGLVRIYSEPNYEIVDGITRLRNGDVAKHGRGQFGTTVTEHSAGLNPYWSDNANVYGCNMKSEYLFAKTTSVQNQFILDGITIVGKDLRQVPQVNTDMAKLRVGQEVKIAFGSAQLETSTKITAIAIVGGVYQVTISPKAIIDTDIGYSETMSVAFVLQLDADTTASGAAGVSHAIAQKSTRNGIIRNFMNSSYAPESDIDKYQSTQLGSVQSSALVMNGPTFGTTEKPIDFISYVNKPLSDSYKHFGTRMRIIGKINNNTNNQQTPIGSTPYHVLTGATPDQNVNINGASGGLAVMVNPTTNIGYYFELVALSESNIEKYEGSGDVANLLFYKIKKDSTTSEAIPVKLWSGLSKIIVDSGTFVGQSRITTEENTTVYDIAVEYLNIGTKLRRFFLYINNQIVATVDDIDPLPIYNNMGLFVRGSSRVMFENIYALTNNYSQNTSSVLDTTLDSVFGDNEIDATESLKKYAMSGVIQSTYLSGISPAQPPKHKLYFEEFGTIMREAAYFNIKYDKAYPALYAKVSPTFNQVKGYTISGFQAGAYGAEFLIFNATDTVINLDETSGNYLRIQGVTFTQQSQNELTVDEYYSKLSDLSNPVTSGSNLVFSPLKIKQDYQDIKDSRIKYGRNDFSLNPVYIQTADDANDLMKWLMSKVTKPRKSIGLSIFANPTIQLGDIVKIEYKDENNIDLVTPSSSRFVVYNIQYSKSPQGPEMNLYLSEVI